jgi:hypothetical protein
LITAALVAATIIAAALAHHDRWIVVTAFALGLVLGAYLVLLETPPSYIENWRTGAEGELRTARVLAPLRRSGYRLLHDLPDRRSSEYAAKANIDHVVVSAAGVFLLDSKQLGGEASIHGHTVRVGRRDDEDDSYELPWLARAMSKRALRLQEDIAQQADIPFVRAVVVFWNDFTAGVVEDRDVVFVHGHRLVPWLREQTPTLDRERVAGVAACIKQVRPPEHTSWWAR